MLRIEFNCRQNVGYQWTENGYDWSGGVPLFIARYNFVFRTPTKYVGGIPVKLAVGLSTMMVVQATTTVISKITNRNKVSNIVKGKGDNLISHFISNDNNSNMILNGYPLNLLVVVDLLYPALLFLFVF